MTAEQAQHVNGHKLARLHVPEPGVEDLDVPEFLRRDPAADVQDTIPFPVQSARPAADGWPQTDAVPAEYREQPETEPQDGGQADEDGGPGSTVPKDPARETPARRPFHRVRTVAGHPVTRGAVRQAAYVAQGAAITARQRRDARSTARHERMMRAAEAIGDHATALEWEQRAAHHIAARHARRMQLLHAPVHAAKGAAYGATTAAGVLLAIGVCLAAAERDPGQVAVPLVDAADVVRFIITLVTILWSPAILLGMAAGIAALWSAGRKQAEVPRWLMPESAKTGPDSVVITPSVVVVALRDLGYADLRKQIKAMADGAAALLGPITVAGCGVEVDVTLPSGVDTGQIMARRRKLAENLGRHEHEVYISKAPAARTVRLWIADSGALDEPVVPSPMVLDQTLRADFVTGRAPWGVDLRGDPVLIMLYQCHLLITGLSNQGKTACMRSLALWAALDPCVEFRLADLKGVGDWSMFGGLATVLIEGPTDEHVIAATEMVEGLVEEIERRIDKLNASGSVVGITPEMARKPGSGFHPLTGIVDEAQVAFMCPAKDDQGMPYGGSKSTSRYFNAVRKVHNQGRAVNVTLWEGTQNPTDQNLPVIVREGAHNRVALVLGTESQSKMALGETPVNKGAAPHELRQGLDKGTVVAVGDGVPVPRNQPAITIRTHYIDGGPAVALAERAKAARKPVQTRSAAEQDALPPLDVLGDVARIVGDAPRLPKGEVMHRLAELDDRYRDWTDARLKAELEAAGAPQYTYNGITHVHGDRVREALSRRFSATDPSETQSENRP